ncbi:ABC transporter substrate-binding protein [Bradyrhizobium arachidis]|uniref:ABC transporter substrate-binding protein n=1 Tax=Bradyrhizobium arachidis TaxID=858423 RepID=UPI002163AAE5|nr:ABC transporter substrate-binding protein [Bradyrhizobium arachidis]UVO35506.1 ABC transporter substrate-binding protein [Bradyrhizobium arachidis]
MAVLSTGSAVILLSQSAFAETVNLRFSWKLKGEYAFFYLGQKSSIYRDAGIDVNLGEGAGAQSALAAVVQGREDLAVVPGIFALTAIQKGMPVKIVALYQPAAPVVLLSHQASPVVKPADLEGKSIASSVGETSTAYLDVFCSRNRIDCSKINKINMDSQVRISQFMQGKVDVVGVYRTSDLPLLREKAGSNFAVLDLPEFGLAVPGLAVVARVDAVEKNASILRRFFVATGKAIEMARSEPDAATAALKTVWPAGPSDAIVREQVEATSRSIPATAGKPLGWIDDATISDALRLIGKVEQVDAPRPPSTFFTNELLTR